MNHEHHPKTIDQADLCCQPDGRNHPPHAGGHIAHAKPEQHMNHAGHHATMAQDFKRRFFVALILTIPVLLLSPAIQNWFKFGLPQFPGQN